jgi:hypothetical protein
VEAVLGALILAAAAGVLLWRTSVQLSAACELLVKIRPVTALEASSSLLAATSELDAAISAHRERRALITDGDR